jgi:hypothetical protein
MDRKPLKTAKTESGTVLLYGLPGIFGITYSVVTIDRNGIKSIQPVNDHQAALNVFDNQLTTISPENSGFFN